MSIDFTAETNRCGQTVLRLVSRGNAIVAELLRLSNYIPAEFLGNDPKYKDILFDFKYLKYTDHYDNKISSSPQLFDLDEEFRETHMPLLERFYILFENIYKYVKDFLKYLKDLEEGVVFIQQTFDSVLVNPQGKQLLAEALYMYGVMLLLMDIKIPGIVRERMLMSYYRYKGSGEIPNIDEICKLCRQTGFVAGQKPPPDYPVEYFSRFKLPDQVVSMIIGRLRSDDIYMQTSYYPLPEHRSTALFTQAGMLYVILYFKPDILKKEMAIMREIVDKHFPDNWVISYFMGFTVDISVEWSRFKAAAAAINNTVQPQFVKELTLRHVKGLNDSMKEVAGFLTEGVLIEEYVLDHINKLLNCLRNCNVTLRWLILHRTTANKKLRDIVLGETDPELILLLLLNTAQFEFELKQMFQGLLDQKQEKWSQCKNQAIERVNELAAYFSGERALATVKDEQLQQWFKEIGTKINELDYQDSTLAGRKIQLLITALEEVEEFHQIESSLHVIQYLADTRDLLKKMIRYANIKEEVLITIATISDISYAWEIINEYVGSMQKRIKKDPSLIIKMRSTFLKLASMLELPLVRISQAKSDDIHSVSKYYSGELVAFVRKTLEIIPVSMFSILNEIIDIQTNQLKEIPTRFPRDELKEHAQLDVRYKLAKATYEISKFTEGILAMEKTLMGIIEVDPKKLLEDGIRKELVNQIASSLDDILIFKNHSIDVFENKLRKLAAKLQGMFRSFEYIQDFVNVYGLKIWQEEFSRIINFNVEQECNRFLKKKIQEYASKYQSEVIPIPKTKYPSDRSTTFMGRLVNELLVQTDPRKTTYVTQMNGWYDSSGTEMVGIRTFTLLHQSVGVFGLSGIDTLLSFMIVRFIQRFVLEYKTLVLKNVQLTKHVLAPIESKISPPSILPQNVQKQYSTGMSKLQSVFPLIFDVVIKVGRAQLIRKHIASELNFSCKLDANPLACSLEVCNAALLKDVYAHFVNPNEKPHPSKDNPLLFELNKYLDTTGMHNPFDKIYITSESLPHLALVLFLFTISCKDRCTYDPSLDTLVRKKTNDAMDGVPFIVGLITLLKQFHSEDRELYLGFLGQYIRSRLDNIKTVTAKNAEIPNDAEIIAHMVDDYCKLADIPRKQVEGIIPPFLCDRIYGKKKK